jgi:hypothetical protein
LPARRHGGPDEGTRPHGCLRPPADDHADPSLSALRAAAEGAGAVAVNSVPPLVAISQAAPHAVTALSSGYSTGFLVVAIAALACAVATALFLGGRTEQEEEIAMIEQGEDATVA